jgi:thiamine monophosphate synthase
MQITHDIMVHGMAGATAQHVVEVLNTQGMDANKQFANTNPLVAAICGSKVDNVRAVLDAGADVNRGIKQGNKYSTPFKLLMRSLISADDRKDIVRLLLDRGATLPDPALWRSSKAYRRLGKMLKDEQSKRRSRK